MSEDDVNELNSEYSVYQFFADDSYEAVKSFVPLSEAMRAFKGCTINVAASVGITSRVIMTDGGDSIIVEWKYNQGITWPPLFGKETFDAVT
jgi:hypothetical protein